MASLSSRILTTTENSNVRHRFVAGAAQPGSSSGALQRCREIGRLVRRGAPRPQGIPTAAYRLQRYSTVDPRAALDTVAEYKWVEPVGKPGTGRTAEWRVNPQVHVRYTERAEFEKKARDAAGLKAVAQRKIIQDAFA